MDIALMTERRFKNYPSVTNVGGSGVTLVKADRLVSWSVYKSFIYNEDNIKGKFRKPFHFKQEARGTTARLLFKSVADNMNSRRLKQDNEWYATYYHRLIYCKLASTLSQTEWEKEN
jgi:hypothetical protein